MEQTVQSAISAGPFSRGEVREKPYPEAEIIDRHGSVVAYVNLVPKDDLVPGCGTETPEWNLDYIVAAMNACMNLNPAFVPELFEAAKDIFDQIRFGGGSGEADSCERLRNAIAGCAVQVKAKPEIVA